MKNFTPAATYSQNPDNGRATFPRPFTIEPLEARDLLAFNGILDGETLRLNQISDKGDVLIDNNGPAGEFRVIDAFGTEVFHAADNLIINMLRSGNSLSLDFDNAVAGFVRAQGIDGNIHLTGESNSVGGDLRLFGWKADQVIDLAVNADLNVEGNLVIGLGNGHDEIRANGNGIHVDKSFRWDRVNEFNNDGTLTVGGSFSANFFDEEQVGKIENEGIIRIDGGFFYNKFDVESRHQTDQLSLGGDCNIQGPILINVGNGSFQEVNLDGATVGGRVTILGGNGDEFVNLGLIQESQDRVNLELKEGDDSVKLGSESLGFLRIDFGGGDDSLESPPQLDFDFTILDWQKTSQIYNSDSGELRIIQHSIIDELSIDNGGIQESFRFSSGQSMIQTVAAMNLRVQMMSHSETGLTFDLVNSVSGDLHVNANSGNRTIRFKSKNSFGGDLRIRGGDGDQFVEFDESAGDIQAKEILIGLGGGTNRLELNGKEIQSQSNIIFREVSQFTNSGSLRAFGNVVFNNNSSTVPSRFRNVGTIEVNEDFVFVGSPKADRLILNGSATISGNTRIALGNAGPGKQAIHLGRNFSTDGFFHLSVGESNGEFIFSSSSSTFIGGDFSVVVNKARECSISMEGDFAGEILLIDIQDSNVDATIDLIAPSTSLTAMGGNGNDTFTLRKDTVLERLVIDFGEGSDTFVDEFDGVYPFPTTLINL